MFVCTHDLMWVRTTLPSMSFSPWSTYFGLGEFEKMVHKLRLTLALPQEANEKGWGTLKCILGSMAVSRGLVLFGEVPGPRLTPAALPRPTRTRPRS
mmetsp:Transcript_136947/g.238031  ORF Transcript_136947/g.238031 Transcript_136947/m.238031 type:complete len:97 (-) Transcript_136947:3847-4137(-)